MPSVFSSPPRRGSLRPTGILQLRLAAAMERPSCGFGDPIARLFSLSSGITIDAGLRVPPRDPRFQKSGLVFRSDYGELIRL